MEATFPYSGNAFFSKSFILLVKTDFLSGGNSFFIGAIFVLVEAIIGIRGKQFSKKELIIASRQLIFWLVETIFSSIFQRLLPVFFRLMETMFQENPSFQLVETNLRANNGFHKKKEKM